MLMVTWGFPCIFYGRGDLGYCDVMEDCHFYHLDGSLYRSFEDLTKFELLHLILGIFEVSPSRNTSQGVTRTVNESIHGQARAYPPPPRSLSIGPATPA